MVESLVCEVKKTSFVATVIVAGTAAIVGCGGAKSTPADVFTIGPVGNVSFNGTVGQNVLTPPAVLVTKNGNPDPGQTVTFAVTLGGGTVTGATQTTGADGTARVGSWTLGTSIGSNTLTATAPNITAALGNQVLFNATAGVGAVTMIVKFAGDSDTTTVGFPVTTKPVAKATDAFGNGVSGVNVTFAVASGGGSLTGASQITGLDGTATVGSWTLGPAPGTNTLTASATGLAGSPLTFTAIGLATPMAARAKLH
jgi:hypothetical protein